MPVFPCVWGHPSCTHLDTVHNNGSQFHHQGRKCPDDCHSIDELCPHARCALYWGTHARIKHGSHQRKSPEMGTELLLHVHICTPCADMLLSCSAIGIAG